MFLIMQHECELRAIGYALKPNDHCLLAAYNVTSEDIISINYVSTLCDIVTGSTHAEWSRSGLRKAEHESLL